MKKILVILTAVFVMLGMMTFVGCGGHKHELTLNAEVAATCTTDGSESYYSCSGCEKIFADENGEVELTEVPVIGKLGHSWDNATCEAPKTCSVCGATEGAANGHSGGSADCENQAVCEVCGESYGELGAHVYDREVVEADYLASEATCTEKATYYKSCKCGEAGEETFEAGELEAHVYDQEVVEETYLATVANCISKATYYKSCVCGKAGTEETFEAGELGSHVYDREVAEADYLATEATCIEQATYYYTCECGEQGTETFSYGELEAHDMTGMVASEDYLATEATCTESAEYYYSCAACGEADEEVFSYGEPNGHNWASIVDDKYLVSEANCSSPAVYNKSCSVCGKEGTATFTNGQTTTHVRFDLILNNQALVSGEPDTYYLSCVDCGNLSETTTTVNEFIGVENGVAFVLGEDFKLNIPENSTLNLVSATVKLTDGTIKTEYVGDNIDGFNTAFKALSPIFVYILEYEVSNGNNMESYVGTVDFSINSTDTVAIGQTKAQFENNVQAIGSKAVLTYVENIGGRKGAFEWSTTASATLANATVTLKNSSLNSANAVKGNFLYIDIYTTHDFPLNFIDAQTTNGKNHYLYQNSYTYIRKFNAQGVEIKTSAQNTWKNKWITVEIELQTDWLFNSAYRGFTIPANNDYGLKDSDSKHIYLDNFRISSTSIYGEGVAPTITQTPVVQSNDYSVSYPEFEGVASPEYIVPGLAEGIIPQGMDVWEAKNLLFITGYFKVNDIWPSSMIVAVDLETGEHKGSYFIKNVDGTYHTGHVGGVAVTEKNIFIANGGKLYRIPLSQLEALGTTGVLNIVEIIELPAGASFANYVNGILWVGEFYLEGTYDTPEWRHMVNNDGNTYCAWIMGYKLKDTESEFSSENWDPDTMTDATPDYIFSITEKIQGATIVNDKIVLSQSYGRTPDSKILVYENVVNNEQDTSYTINDKQVPVWFLDSGVAVKSYTTLPMSEGVANYNDKLLILFESGAAFYKDDGGKNPTDHVWSMDLGE